MEIDKIWTNGNIYTVNSSSGKATTIACYRGKIVHVGNEIEAPRDAQVIDLKGRTVVPGFFDSHLHMELYAESLVQLRIRDLSKEEILEAVAGRAKTTPKDKWLVGGLGWNNDAWENTNFPTKEELDSVAPHHLVMLPRMDGHTIWVNSRALQFCDISNDTPNPENGEFFRDASGRLTGCAANTAADIIKSHIPPPSESERLSALLEAQGKLLSYGVTSVQDMMTTMQTVKDIKKLYETERFKIRFSGALFGVFDGDKDSELYQYFEYCPEVNLYDGHFSVRAVKFLADGAFGAQSAWLKEEYSDRIGHFGSGVYDDDTLYHYVKTAAERKMQVIIHAIGDRTIDQVLDVYERVLGDKPIDDHRFHIEHFQLINGDSRERALRLGIWAGMQPTHAPNSAAMAMSRLGEKRAANSYPLGMVCDVLGKFAAGSDAPVAPPCPIDGIHSAVTRTNAQLQPTGGFFMHNSISREKALKGYTIWGAQAQFAEQERGSLEVGKYADFVILDKDIMTVSADEILDVNVMETIISGEPVFRRTA